MDRLFTNMFLTLLKMVLDIGRSQAVFADAIQSVRHADRCGCFVGSKYWESCR